MPPFGACSSMLDLLAWKNPPHSVLNQPTEFPYIPLRSDAITV